MTYAPLTRKIVEAVGRARRDACQWHLHRAVELAPATLWCLTCGSIYQGSRESLQTLSGHAQSTRWIYPSSVRRPN